MPSRSFFIVQAHLVTLLAPEHSLIGKRELVPSMGACQQIKMDTHRFDHASRVAERPRAFYSQLLLSQEFQSKRIQKPQPIRVSNLRFRYPGRFLRRKSDFALQNLSFGIEEGCCLGLLGANGSGKSTLLACLAGTLAPTGGEIFWLGNKQLSLEIQRTFGILPEAELPFPTLPARHFLNMTAKAIGIPKKEAKARCEALLEEFGLKEAAGKPHGKLSKGMKRRLGLAVILLLDPSLLLLDEPLSGIDPIGVEAVRNTLIRHKEKGGTAIVSTHQLEELEDLFDQIMILDQGRIVGIGTVHEILGEEGTWAFEIEGVEEASVLPLLQPLLDSGARLRNFGPSRQALGRFLLNLGKES